ncbi:MAG: metallophosphoesterase [Acidimicrobiia bacterium]|nr:metallophosphoesterase [Acidimicrobiia bacterium]
MSDVHGAADALARMAPPGSTVFVLGDLVNLIDYRTMEGIIPDVVGVDVVRRIVRLRTEADPDAAAGVWAERTAEDRQAIQERIADRMRVAYGSVARALEGYTAYVTYGNVDRVAMMTEALPGSARFTDGESVEVDGIVVGFAGGGIPAIGSGGEVPHDEMEAKLAKLGPVEVLCTHVPPAIDVLAQDLLGPIPKGSPPILDYLRRHRPRLHLFGDVHQPRATRWRVGTTTCHNVGYFRATGRPFLLG